MEAGSPSVKPGVGDGVPARLAARGLSRAHVGERAIRVFLVLMTLISVATTVGIVVSLARETFLFFQDVGIVSFLTGTEWSPLFADPKFGVLPLVWGTVLVTIIAIVVAVPLGLGSAIYLSEYAGKRLRRIVKPALEVLAGIPTIVFGYFALTFVTPTVLRDILGLDVQVFNALSAGIVMGIMVLPTIASVSEDAMSAVPRSLREAGYGLGSTRMQVALRVVVPAATSGIVAAAVLGISRAIGETMIVLVAAGQIPSMAVNPLDAHETMTAFIAATGKGDVPTGSIGYKTIFAVGSTLFVMTLIMNAIAIRFVRKSWRAYE